MKKTAKKKETTIVKESFKSLESFLDTISDRPLNEAFKNETTLASMENESHKKESGRAPWAGSYTYNEAADVLRNGYKEPLEKMKKAILKIGRADNYQRPRAKNDFIGFSPNVPNYLSNTPLTMINRERQAPKTKTIHLIYSFCAAAKTKPDDMVKAGINFISLVNSLEKQGYRVKIDIIFSTKAGETAASMLINLKEYSQATNLLKLAFPLVHVSMLRRFAFKWLETTPDLKDRSFINGYGTPLNFVFNDSLTAERDFMVDKEIIKGKNSYYCNLYTALKARNVEDLAEKMEIVKS